jgi:ribosomal protein S18 acetylase RimI-like enzyme
MRNINLSERRKYMVKIQLAIADDLPEILVLQKLPFKNETALYEHAPHQPLAQSLEDLQKECKQQIFLKAVKGGEIIGTVRAYRKRGVCYISKLAVQPEQQNAGVGTRLMRQLEEIFENTDRFELFTGHKSRKNIHLYHKLGYTIFKSVKLNDSFSFVYMEKKVP